MQRRGLVVVMWSLEGHLRSTAATTGYLALGAALVAIPAGYLALFAMASDPGVDYPVVFPIGSLGTLAIGVPVIGAVGAYGVTRSSPRRIAPGA